MNGNTYNNGNNHNLNFEEEIMLSKKIQDGNKAKEILGKSGSLSEEERKRLELTVKEGDLAFDQLVDANVPRAMKFAYETWRKNRFGVNELEDYQQTAMKVICTCARTFDWTKGYRFGTFAHNCLQHEMLRENARSCYALRVPEEGLALLNAAKQTSGSEDGKGAAADRSDSDKLVAACSSYLSLQAPIGEDGNDTELGDLFQDTNAETAEQIEDRIDFENSVRQLNRALDSLSEDEKFILQGRFGFFGEDIRLKDYVGTAAKSISGVQKKQDAAVRHLREMYESLPLAI